MSMYMTIAEQFTIYVGSALFTVGALGNLINAGVFYKQNLQQPSILLLFIASCFNFVYIFLGLFTRLLSASLNSDVGSNNVAWCKLRLSLLQFCALMSVSSVCYATIDQYLITSAKETLRRLSKISTTWRISCLLFVFWMLYSIPLLLFSNLVVLNDGRMVCTFVNNVAFSRFASYFNLPVVWGIAPIATLGIFGTLTYRNVSLLRNARNRDAVHRHLTSMILLHIIFIVIGTLPYTFFYIYSAITLMITKSADRRTLEASLANIVAVILYFPNSCSFLAYYITSTTYRQQVRKYLHIPFKVSQVEPGRTLAPRPKTGHNRY